jgi:hypothetical protein
MTKLERALKAAEELPEDLREQIGEDLLHFIDKYLALCDDIDAGIGELDAGQGVPAADMLAELRARVGL